MMFSRARLSPHCFSISSSCLGRSTMQAVSRSGLAWFRRFPGFARLGADRPSRRRRPDAERPPRGDRCDRGLGLGSEERAAAGTELKFLPDHADRDTVDIRNVRAAKTKRIVRATLLLLGGAALASALHPQKRQRPFKPQPQLH